LASVEVSVAGQRYWALLDVRAGVPVTEVAARAGAVAAVRNSSPRFCIRDLDVGYMPWLNSLNLRKPCSSGRMKR
jgi:hypothetical protein